MNLYLISQDVNKEWDTYDSAVVAAESEKAARLTHPAGVSWDGKKGDYDGTWCAVTDVKATLLGISVPGISGVICASFNAG